MNLGVLKLLEARLEGISRLLRARRVDYNIIELDFKGYLLYANLAKSNASFFRTKEPLVPARRFSAPFDLMLSRLDNTHLLSARVDGTNRIIALTLKKDMGYKSLTLNLVLELTGRHTNAIITDEASIILEALHHIGPRASYREIRPKIPLAPLKQREGVSFEELEPESLETLLLEKDIRLARFRTKKAALLKDIAKRRASYAKKLASLDSKEALEVKARENREKANLLLAHIDELPSHRGTITLEGVDIELSRGGSYEVTTYFKAAKRLEAKAKSIYKEEANLNERLKFFADLADIIEVARDANALVELHIRPSKNTAQRVSKERFMSVFIDEIKVSVGKNAKENIALLKAANANDIWLHIKDVPSSHMIIHCGKNAPKDEMIKKAASLLLKLNGLNINGALVDYTKRKFVKLQNGANVLYNKYQTIYIKEE